LVLSELRERVRSRVRHTPAVHFFDVAFVERDDQQAIVVL
jgi:hypothetical protein